MTNFIVRLYQLPQTVFTFQEIALLFPEISNQSLKDKLSHAVKTHKLLRLRKGIFAKESFNHLELANKVYTPSYISLETVLKKEALIFQDYKTIFASSYLTRKLNVSGVDIYYRKLKYEVLLNNFGIINEKNYTIASKERAFLDAIFFYKDYHFDNLTSLDWNKVKEMKKIYESKILESRVENYYEIFKKENARQK